MSKQALKVSEIGNESISVRDCKSESAIRHVIGGIMLDPSKLEDSGLTRKDFPDAMHQLIFTAISNIVIQYHLFSEITPDTVIDYYSTHKEFAKLLSDQDAVKYMQAAKDLADLDKFELYAKEVRKYTLLRSFKKQGFDISYFYNPETTNAEVERVAHDRFNNTSLDGIIKYFQDTIDTIDKTYNTDLDVEFIKFGYGSILQDKLDEWKKGLQQGSGYTSQYLTSITTGIRKGKFMITSAATGVGKSRTMIANMCYSFLPKFWDEKKKKWCIPDCGGQGGKALYIGTEMDLKDEVMPLVLAYMCAIDSDKITNGLMDEEETKRVNEAVKLLNDSWKNDSKDATGVLILNKPDFTITWLEKTIRYFIRQYNVTAIFFDYIFASSDMVSEYSDKVGRNTQVNDYKVLQELSTKLKELCQKNDIYIETSTQVSGNWHEYTARDSEIVRGSKGVIDKVDRACILSDPEPQEVDLLAALKKPDIMKYEPNKCLTVYKNRDGRYNRVKIWGYFDTGKLRWHDLYCTNFEVTQILDIQKVRAIYNAKTNSYIKKTLAEAEKDLKSGLITQKDYDAIKKADDADKTKIEVTPEMKAATEFAANAINETFDWKTPTKADEEDKQDDVEISSQITVDNIENSNW